MDWFGEYLEFVSLRPGRFQQIGGGRLSRKQENFAFRYRLSDLNRNVNSGDGFVFEDDVADHQIGTRAARVINGLLPGIDGRRIEAVLVEDDRKGIGYHSFIIYHQYPRLTLTRHAVISLAKPWHESIKVFRL